uniref:Six-cysteine peptide SCIFF n=1 Tax=Caenorhabditis tropicalis TaxID=1561998 RepID=A0A1I7UGD6_9PELO
MSNCKQSCENTDHKDNGLNHDVGGINDMLDKEELKKKELPQMRGDVQGRIKSDLCQCGEKCGTVEPCGQNCKCH